MYDTVFVDITFHGLLHANTASDHVLEKGERLAC